MRRILIATFCLLNAVSCFAQAANISYKVFKARVDNINLPISARVAFFVPVADSVNQQGINFRTIVLDPVEEISDTSRSWISPLADSIAKGAFIVRIETIGFPDPDALLAVKRSIIDARFNKFKSKFIKKFYAEYKFYGLERIVP